MLDVLLYLFEHCMDEGRDVTHDEVMLKDMLKDAGFAPTEINKAFSWLEDLIQQGQEQGTGREAGSRHSFRVYTPSETVKLDRRCRGFLSLLEQMKIVCPLTRELIIERAMALEMEELDLERFKWIVMMVLANQSADGSTQEWIESLVFDGPEGIVH